MTTAAAEVHAEISELLVRYATGIDRRDWGLLRSCFTDDVAADYGDVGVWHGVDELVGAGAHRGPGSRRPTLTSEEAPEHPAPRSAVCAAGS